jgi:hypothetical protein
MQANVFQPSTQAPTSSTLRQQDQQMSLVGSDANGHYRMIIKAKSDIGLTITTRLLGAQYYLQH